MSNDYYRSMASAYFTPNQNTASSLQLQSIANQGRPYLNYAPLSDSSWLVADKYGFDAPAQMARLNSLNGDAREQARADLKNVNYNLWQDTDEAPNNEPSFWKTIGDGAMKEFSASPISMSAKGISGIWNFLENRKYAKDALDLQRDNYNFQKQMLQNAEDRNTQKHNAWLSDRAGSSL